MKTGRNDPCPCGSRLKYKKCCLNKIQKQNTGARDKEVLKYIENFYKKDRERVEQFGHVREPMSTFFNGHRLQISGNTVHFSPRWKFFTDFLLDFVPEVFGEDWGKIEMANLFEERHPIVQFKQKTIEYMRSEEQKRPNAQGFYETIPNGYMAAYMAFAYDLFVVKDNGRLDEELIQRLKTKEFFFKERDTNYLQKQPACVPII